MNFFFSNLTITYLAVGKRLLILCNSDSLSKVMTSTPTAAAWRICEAGFAGFANTIRLGSTPIDKTLLISV